MKVPLDSLHDNNPDKFRHGLRGILKYKIRRIFVFASLYTSGLYSPDEIWMAHLLSRAVFQKL